MRPFPTTDDRGRSPLLRFQEARLFVGASLLANGAHRWLRCFGWTSFPLPNPLPEGRGDRWAESDVLESAGWHRDFWLKPFLISARTSPLSLQGEGWGEGALKPDTYARSRASSLLRRAPRRLQGTSGVGADSVRDWIRRPRRTSRWHSQRRSIRMTPKSPLAPNGPLSLRERAGVRGRSQPNAPSPQ